MKEKIDQKGQITVFLTLLFLMMSLTFLCFFDGIRLYLGRGLVDEAMTVAGREVTSNYHNVLAGRYHLFALDPKEKAYIIKDGEEYLKDYLQQVSYSYSQLTLQNTVSILDRGGTIIEDQAIKYMECKKAKNLVEEIAKLAGYCESEQKQKDSTMTCLENVAEEEQEEETDDAESDTETSYEKKEETKWKSIKELLESIMHSGVLLYVCDDRALSNLSIQAQALPSHRTGNSAEPVQGEDLTFSFSDLKEVREELEDDQKDPFTDLKKMAGKTLLLAYIHENFRDWTDQDWNQPNALVYEKEYLIAGRNNDRDNLRIVANKILRMRFAANLSYVLTNPQISLQAELMGMSLCGFLGFPQAAEAVKYLLLAALSYGESMLDLHSLFAGKKVPLMKDSLSWMTGFDNFVELLQNKTIVKEGGINLAYQEYLDIFLGKEILKNSLCLKMADIMQSNVGLQEESFDMAECIFSYDWQADFSCRLWNMRWIAGESRISLQKSVSYE